MTHNFSRKTDDETEGKTAGNSTPFCDAKTRISNREKHIGEQVRQHRILRNVSQKDLACSLGITFQQLQKHERGINRISAGRLEAIAIALNMPIADFYYQHTLNLNQSNNASANTHGLNAPRNITKDNAANLTHKPLTLNEKKFILKLRSINNTKITTALNTILNACMRETKSQRY